jgi:hypothetical protein
MKTKNCYWYIEPLDPPTNEMMVALLALNGDDTTENFSGITDAEGNIHQVWQVEARHVATLRASRPKEPRLKFRVWKRDTNYGVLKRCEFMEKPKRRYSAKKKKPTK